MMDEEQQQQLEARVSALESQRFECPKGVGVDESMRRARAHVESLNLSSANWKWVPEPYYTWPLEKRAKMLNAATTHMLCKSLLMENKKVDTYNGDKTNPKFMLVVIQYEATLDVKKLATAIRKLRPVDQRLEESAFDLRVASSEDNDRITGYAHNSVTPFGLKEPVAIYLAEAITNYGYFWMGGGHIHLKLGMSVTDFQKMPNATAMDLSVPRKEDDEIVD
jgi:prolyl-tRNA editing enzyme YbaK/EbsC (Cys-tRNA(Pro) deacylase)